MNRANAVKEALVQKFNLEPNAARGRRPGLGSAGRSEESVRPGQEPPRGDQGLSGRKAIEFYTYDRIDRQMSPSAATGPPAGEGREPLAQTQRTRPLPTPVAAAVRRSPCARHSRLAGRSCSGVACLAVCGAIWWGLTAATIAEERLLGPTVLPSPAETFGDFHSLWFDHALTRNTAGQPEAGRAGVRAGGAWWEFPWACSAAASAASTPSSPRLMIGGRNIPVAAVIPLTLSLFGIGEFQKIMFIFIACVAFIVMDYGHGHRRREQPLHRHRLHPGAPRAGRSCSRCWSRWPCPASSIRCGCCSAWPSATSCWPK